MRRRQEGGGHSSRHPERCAGLPPPWGMLEGGQKKGARPFASAKQVVAETVVWEGHSVRFLNAYSSKKLRS